MKLNKKIPKLNNAKNKKIHLIIISIEDNYNLDLISSSMVRNKPANLSLEPNFDDWDKFKHKAPKFLIKIIKGKTRGDRLRTFLKRNIPEDILMYQTYFAYFHLLRTSSTRYKKLSISSIDAGELSLED